MKIDKSWYIKPKGIKEELCAGGVALCNKKGAILVALTHENNYPNFVLPKGHIERGENAEQAAIREIKEETGLTNLNLICKLGIKERLDATKKYWKKTDYFLFTTEYTENKLVEWFPVNKLPEMFWPEQKQLIEGGWNVLIFGLGVNQGGVGAAKFFAKLGANVKVTDLKTAENLKISIDQLKEFKNITYTLGEHKIEDIDWANLIIKNPAVKPGNKYLLSAKDKKKTIETDMGIFFKFVKPQQVIGVTGTKGKSTTASLIYEALKISHPGGVILAGNIGKSVLETLEFINPETWVVLEISSFQTEGLMVSSKYAVITNIYPDHLNYHPDMTSYIDAKKTIAKYQSGEDFLFLNKEDPILNSPGFIKDLKAKIIFYSVANLPKTFKPTLPGNHNLSNNAGALAVCRQLGIEGALDAMNNFKGAQFRLETIKIWEGITIINDSAATTPDATIQALKTYPNSILIAGGMNKKLSYTKLTSAINQYAKKVYFLKGDATDQIQKNAPTYDNLEQILNGVKKEAKSRDVILFSPGATSFNLFQNEFDRGRRFNEAVEKIF